MRSTQQFSITLSNDLAELVKKKVASGEYASESEVIREGLRALQKQERALEDWLRTEVAEAYDLHKANPAQARSAAQVRERLKDVRKQLRKAG